MTDDIFEILGLVGRAAEVGCSSGISEAWLCVPELMEISELIVGSRPPLMYDPKADLLFP
jgi:hypothetical protein